MVIVTPSRKLRLVSINNGAVFIAGVHGVGKTTLGRSLASKLGVPFHSAGELLKKSAEATARSKSVADVSGNQDKLVKAVLALKLKGPFVLDGHFCLLDGNQRPTLIPFQTYRDLGITAVAVIIDEAAAIARRLWERDAASLELKLIDRLQNAEMGYARLVAEILELPIRFFSVDQSEEMHQWIAGILTSPSKA